MPRDEIVKPPAVPLPALPAPALPLAHGELGVEDALELRALKQYVQGQFGFFCEGYKEKCLRRRIAVRMRARGVHRYADYAALLGADELEVQRLLDALTINVSKFYRNADVWEAVETLVLPELFAQAASPIQVWSAGTAGGEEAYSAAMLFHDYAVRNGLPPEGHRVLGTDIDRLSLAFAARGEYADFAMTDIAASVRDRWFDHDTVYRLKPEARRFVRFAELDLIRDAYPSAQQLIFCRNVIIYFERSVQELLFRKFHEALAPGGFLVLGKVEAIFGASASLYETVANRQRIFRKS